MLYERTAIFKSLMKRLKMIIALLMEKDKVIISLFYQSWSLCAWLHLGLKDTYLAKKIWKMRFCLKNLNGYTWNRQWFCFYGRPKHFVLDGKITTWTCYSIIVRSDDACSVNWNLVRLNLNTKGRWAVSANGWKRMRCARRRWSGAFDSLMPEKSQETVELMELDKEAFVAQYLTKMPPKNYWKKIGNCLLKTLRNSWTKDNIYIEQALPLFVKWVLFNLSAK